MFATEIHSKMLLILCKKHVNLVKKGPKKVGGTNSKTEPRSFKKYWKPYSPTYTIIWVTNLITMNLFINAQAYFLNFCFRFSPQQKCSPRDIALLIKNKYMTFVVYLNFVIKQHYVCKDRMHCIPPLFSGLFPWNGLIAKIAAVIFLTLLKMPIKR